MTILVTGAAGFLGGAVMDRFRHDRKSVIGAVRQCVPDRKNQFVIGNISAESDWSGALSGVNIVIHCAAMVHVMKDLTNDPLTAFRSVNLYSTIRLAEQAIAAGVKRFVFVSSIKVNGEATADGQIFEAGDLPNPTDPYGISKQEAEQALLEMAAGTCMEVVIVRAPLVYGPRVKGNFAALVKLVRSGMPLPLSGIHNQRSMVALDNLVDLLVQCGDQAATPQAAGQIFLVSDGVDLSTSEMVEKIGAAYGVKVRKFPLPQAFLSKIARMTGKEPAFARLFGSLRVSNKKLENLLSWTPLVTMDQQLSKMVEYETFN